MSRFMQGLHVTSLFIYKFPELSGRTYLHLKQSPQTGIMWHLVNITSYTVLYVPLQYINHAIY